MGNRIPTLAWGLTVMNADPILFRQGRQLVVSRVRGDNEID